MYPVADPGFSRGKVSTLRDVLTNQLTILFQKLYENEDILVKGEHILYPLDPLMVPLVSWCTPTLHHLKRLHTKKTDFKMSDFAEVLLWFWNHHN